MAQIIDIDYFEWQRTGVGPMFQQRKLHLVCVAATGLTTCSACAGIDAETLQKKVDEVNRRGETGTFWPVTLMTIVPLLRCEEREGPDEDGVDDFLRRSFQDVAIANRDYIKQKTLHIDLNGWIAGYDYRRARKIAEEVLGNDPEIDTIYFAPSATEAM